MATIDSTLAHPVRELKQIALLLTGAKHLMTVARSQLEEVGGVPRTIMVFGPDGKQRVLMSLEPFTDAALDAAKRDAIQRAGGDYAFVAEVAEAIVVPAACRALTVLHVAEQAIVLRVYDAIGNSLIYVQPFAAKDGRTDFGAPYLADRTQVIVEP